MDTQDERINVNGVEYVRIDEAKDPCNTGRPVIVRTINAGVHYGYLAKEDGMRVELYRSRRLWAWKAKSGVALSGVAANGIDDGCKVDSPVHIVLTQAIEIISASAECVRTIEEYQ